MTLAVGLSGRKIFAVIVALTLFGCSNDPLRQSNMASFAALAKAPLSLFAPGAKAQALTLTRDMLKTIETPVDLITLEASGSQALIARVGSNQGAETWGSADQKTFSFRQGILVATRGLGPDLMGATVPQISQLAEPGSSFSRIQAYLGDEDREVQLSFECRVSLMGREAVPILGRNYDTTRLQETCAADHGSFTNDYWFTPGGKLQQSRQWIGKNAGYLIIQVLRD